MQTETTSTPEAITFERDYAGSVSEAQHVRADLAKVAAECPAADELILVASELATNAVLHSRSGDPGRIFTVRVTLYLGEYVWVEVIDQGGPWVSDGPDDERGRGLTIVASIAGDGNWGIDGDTACRVAWFRLDWYPS